MKKFFLITIKSLTFFLQVSLGKKTSSLLLQSNNFDDLSQNFQKKVSSFVADINLKIAVFMDFDDFDLFQGTVNIIYLDDFQIA
jgi:hypothetical protein